MHIVRRRDKASDPCILKQDCIFCNIFTTDQVAQLATPSYKPKKNRKSEKSDKKMTSLSALVDLSEVFALGPVESEQNLLMMPRRLPLKT